MDRSGAWKEDVADIEKVIEDYFDDIFSYINSGMDQTEDVLVVVDRKINENTNEILLADFTKEEILTALKQMHPDKASGPDNFSALFFQKYWNMMGNKVVAACLDVLNNGAEVGNLNETYVVLIPKKKQSVRVSDFCPINLCNMIYKIITKALANRLKLTLDEVISPFQSAFIPGRLIMDNVMVGFWVSSCH